MPGWPNYFFFIYTNRKSLNSSTFHARSCYISLMYIHFEILPLTPSRYFRFRRRRLLFYFLISDFISSLLYIFLYFNQFDLILYFAFIADKMKMTILIC